MKHVGGRYFNIILLDVTVLFVVGAVFAANYYNNVDANKDNSSVSVDSSIPTFLTNNFDTDWSKYDPVVNTALSGGPGKDGIPAIDNPKFEPINEFKYSEDVQAIVIKDGDSVKVYPYNILVWHEIVNDTVNGQPVAVTFCPLRGSAIVYSRTIDGQDTTFGVSGALIESNMIMYDRATESLWQQSTGRSIAGDNFNKQLDQEAFQLLTIADVKAKYPNALILSDDTRYGRDYARNPYSGYSDTEQLIFNTSVSDSSYPAKDIFVVFNYNSKSVATPFSELQPGQQYSKDIDGQTVTIKVDDNKELIIQDETGTVYPFYFEMWFSWIAQHQDDGIVNNITGE